MDQRISLITLGVADMAASAAFYEALGWTRVDSPDGVIAFDLIGQVLGLYPVADLERDLGQARGKGFSGITLGHNLSEKSDVVELTERARAAGATVLKEPGDIFWAGTSPMLLTRTAMFGNSPGTTFSARTQWRIPLEWLCGVSRRVFRGWTI